MAKSFLCSVSRAHPENWTLARDLGLWGVPGRVRSNRPRVEAGDLLYIWVGGVGYTASAKCIGPARAPLNDDEAPWVGGRQRYRFVVPFEVIVELRPPVFLGFDDEQRQRATRLFKGNFQKGFFWMSRPAAGVLEEMFAEPDKYRRELEEST